MEGMTDNELKTVLIEQYTNLQRIKKANGDTVSKRAGRRHLLFYRFESGLFWFPDSSVRIFSILIILGCVGVNLTPRLIRLIIFI